MSERETDDTVPSRPGASLAARTPRAQLRSLLAQTDSHAHGEVGAFPLVEALWGALAPPAPPEVRGERMRAILWYIIDRQHRLALAHAGATPRVSGRRSAHDDAWHVLWLSHRWDATTGFHQRYTIELMVRLGRYVASGVLAAAEHADAHGPPARQRGKKSLTLAGLLRGGGLTSLDEYPIRAALGESWHKQKLVAASTALLAHLRPDDPLLREAFAHCHALAPALADISTGRARTPFDGVAARQAPAAEGSVRETRAPAHAAAARPPWHASQRRLRAGHARRSATNASAGSSRTRRRSLLARGALVLCAVVLVAMIPLLGRGAMRFMRPPTRVPLALARVAGFVIAQQWSHDEPRVLAAIEPRTGAWRTLWPAGQIVHGEWQPVTTLSGYIWLTSPAFAPSTRLLAFTARDSAGGASIWVASIAFGADSWPVIAAPGPRELVAGCRPCDTLAWSPSGQWLLYNGPTGLVALAPASLTRQPVTTAAGDQWPACAADGRWLAFQRRWGDVVALPARDCLPLADPWPQARYLEGFAPAWRPAWSPDGRWLAFVSALGGPWSVYVVAFDALARTPNIGARDTSYLESLGGCTDPLWAPRDPPGGDVLVYGCDAPTADNHHGSLVVVPAGPQPAWEALLSSGIMNRDSLCWLPAPL